MSPEGRISEGPLRVSEGGFLRVGGGQTGFGGDKRARRECCLEAFDAGK